MKRRGGAAERPVKDRTRSATGSKARKAPTAHASIADLQKELERRTRERDEALEQQTATSQVLKVISSSPGELQLVFDTMLKNAIHICEAQFGILSLFDGTNMRHAASYNVPAAFEELRRREPVVPLDRSVAGRVVEAKGVVRFDDIATEERHVGSALVKVAGARSVVGIPMLKEDELVGVIVIYRTEVRPFSDKQVKLLTDFAAQAVIAIENTRLLNELRESLEQQTATSEVLKVISSTPGELEPVFNAMLANATRICEATFGHLWLFEGNTVRGVAVHSKQSYADYRRRNPVVDLRDNPEVPLDRLAKTKQVVHIPDLRADQSYIGKNDRIVALVEVAGARTFVAVPMLKDGELIGAIAMIVRKFARSPISRSNWLRTLPPRLSSLSRTPACSTSCANRCSSRRPLPMYSRSSAARPLICKRCSTRWSSSAAKLCEAYDCIIFLRQGDKLHIKAMHGPIGAGATEYEIGRGWVAGCVFLDRTPIHVHDLSTSEEFPEGREMARRRVRGH